MAAATIRKYTADIGGQVLMLLCVIEPAGGMVRESAGAVFAAGPCGRNGDWRRLDCRQTLCDNGYGRRERERKENLQKKCCVIDPNVIMLFGIIRLYGV